MDTQLQRTRDRLHSEAKRDMPQIIKGLSKGIFRKLRPEDMRKAYIAMSEEQGQYMLRLLRESKAKHIVEFGTSFGVSTLYLAEAARENGGKVITTELLPEKCKVAAKNFREAGLSEFIDLREGDALKTFQDCPSGIEFLLLDGWNDLYLPLLEMLEPKFAKGCVLITDNTNFPSAKTFLNYVRNNPKYRSAPIAVDKGGTEKSVWLG